MSQNKTASAKALKALADSVGDFIRYWGFRRIHGQIWTQVYLSSDPLSGADLVRRLKVSKALVSPALSELEDYGLILPAGGDGKTKLYTAAPDVFGVIKKILQSRERKLIQRSAQHCQKLMDLQAPEPALDEPSDLNTEHLQQLSGMIQSAEAALDLVVHFASPQDLSHWQDLEKEWL